MTTSAFSNKLSSIFSAVRSRGVRGGLRFVGYRLYEEVFERRLGIQTRGTVSPEDLGHDSPELLEYSPTPYHALRYCLARVPIEPGEDSLLDYGCGMGRVITLAATKPFRRVVGIEISPAMAERARENIGRAKKRLKSEVHVDVADARTYQVPDDITVIHLYNPFTGDPLAQTVERIRESQRRRPRDVTIIYGNPGRFEEMFGGENWLTRKLYRDFYPSTGYAIYICRPDSKSN